MSVHVPASTDMRPASPGRVGLLVTAVAICAVWLGHAGCTGSEEPQATTVPRIERVRIVGTELLTPPEIVLEPAYIPSRSLSIAPDPADTNGAVEVIGFYLTVSADDGDDLKLRVRDTRTLVPLSVEHVPTPTAAPAADFAADLLESSSRAILAAENGVYWVEPATQTTRGLQHRLGIALPAAALPPSTSVEVYATTTSTGAPAGGDSIELVRAFYYVAALGDSAMWGNGLEEKDKFTTLVADALERELGVHVIRVVMAISGATIRTHPADGVCKTRCGDGEVPEVFTSITTQANILPAPELYDLILLDGCGNDIQIERILAPTDNTTLIRELADEFCFAELANLLIRVRARAPQAPIVVTGYFPFVSADSDLSELGVWAVSQGINLGSEEELAATLANFVVNSEVFQQATAAAMSAAVELVSSLDESDPGIAFVDPGFGPTNATFASEAWLWGLTRNVSVARQLNIDLSLFPEDPMLDERVDRCVLPNVAPFLLPCVYGALGHPNVAGAQAYATGIISVLRDLGVLAEQPAND